MDLAIKKVKVIPKQSKVKIDYVLDGDDMAGTYSEPPAPEFYTSLSALNKTACEILEMDGAMADRLVPFAVSFSYGANTGVISASIQSKFEIPMSDTETIINTPMRKVSIQYEDGLSIEQCNAIEEFLRNATEYLKGHRAQTNLFENPPKDVTPKPLEIEG
ncbi:hypothetical protein SELR_18450 [Selenomonas ruminantium subsp. lactilytica TAM6421]|uniref:Uncharacterized protein n=1 Tax=Selenomonas ruminantium subsp. lactilytica (strain NBRC 103574 / TAM6421) TaxID=927704 RepID=I0GS16_SELRL|nr:hypothetical protein [Selenomonas ruminantium]BAL83553.1 hypothetical protein SELR_18450 [Selenomonas ruminantium subsp. lactilytica TAM6421]